MTDKAKHNIFQDTVLRRDSKGTLYLMNHPEKGWASSSFIIESEQHLLDKYNVKLGEWTRDKFSEYCPVLVLPAEQLPIATVFRADPQ